jgi:O-antigen/teichoic acid export membrane protein
MATQAQFILKQSFIYGFGNTMAKLSGVLLLPLYVVFTSTEEFGLIALFETIYQFILVLSGWGAKSGFSRFYYTMPDETRKRSLFFTIFMFTVVTSFAAVILCMSLLIIWSDAVFHYEVSQRVMIFFSISTLSRLLFDVPYILLRLQQKAVSQTFYQSTNIILTIALTFALLKFAGMGFKGIFLAQMVANMATLLMVVPVITVNSVVRIEWDVLKQSISYGYPLAVSNILTIALTLSDRHILNQYQSLDEVGSYSMAYKISSIIQMIVVTSFITSYTFYYYKSLEDKDDQTKVHVKIFRYFVLFIAIIGFALVAFRREAVGVVSLGRDTYSSSLPLIPILIAGLFFSGIRQIFVLPLTKLKKTSLISVLSVGIAVINIALNFLFIPQYGKLAASYTGGVAQLVGCVAFYFALKHYGENDYDIVVVVKCFVVFALSAAAIMLVPDYGWIVNSLIGIASVAIFIVAMFVLKVIEIDEVKEIKRLVFNKLNRKNNA